MNRPSRSLALLILFFLVALAGCAASSSSSSPPPSSSASSPRVRCLTDPSRDNQATIDLVLYLAFFVPGAAAMVWAGWDYAKESWLIREHSTITVDGPPVYPFKAFIPVAGGLILLQGLVEIVRCVVALKDGAWPSRQQDVEEVDVGKLKEMVHVKDEDIAALDEVVVHKEQEGGRP